MELSSAVFRNVLSPLSAFATIETTAGKKSAGESDGAVPEFGQATRLSDQTSSQPSASPEGRGAGPSCIRTLACWSVAQTSLTLGRYKWTIQGADPDARRLFAVPRFALDRPPLRIDVYLPPLEHYIPEVRSLLRPEEVVYSPRERIPCLAISQWLAGVLEQWCTAYDSGHGNDGRFQREYESMPFGSRILVTIRGLSPCSAEALGMSAGKAMVDHEIYLVPDYDVEQGMLTVDSLREMWGDLGARNFTPTWPEVIDLEDVRLKRQFHEAISIVTVSGAHSGSKPNGKNDIGSQSHDISRLHEPEREKEYVFKSLTRDQRHLYNELKMLLSLKPHDNVIPRPRYIVTKKARFGGRRGVCGFVLDYFSVGSLKQFLLEQQQPLPTRGASLPPWAAPPPELAAGSNECIVTTCSGQRGAAAAARASLEQKVRWAKQMTRALIHVNTNGNDKSSNASEAAAGWCGFYPDLKPDNIVLRPFPSAAQDSTTAVTEDTEQDVIYDAVLLDLEQRGGWFSWSPPEIKYLEYLEILLGTSTDDDEMSNDEFDLDKLEELQDELDFLLGEYYSFCFDPSTSATDTTAMPPPRGNGHRRNVLNGKTARGYFKSDGGFSSPWLGLLAKREHTKGKHQGSARNDIDDEGRLDLEKAQVFMLGKLLWCIFEQEALMRCGINHEMLSDFPIAVHTADGIVGRVCRKRKKVFPEFEHTPGSIKTLIKACTAGAEEWEANHEDGGAKGWRVVLNSKGRLVPSNYFASFPSQDCGGGLDVRLVSAEDTQRQATEYWKGEVDKARAFISDVVAYERRRRATRTACGSEQAAAQVQRLDNENRESGSKLHLPELLGKARSRPRLEQVLRELERIFP